MNPEETMPDAFTELQFRTAGAESGVEGVVKDGTGEGAAS